MEQDQVTPQPEAQGPVIAVYADGKIVVGASVTLGEVLAALEAARAAVLGIRLQG